MKDHNQNHNLENLKSIGGMSLTSGRSENFFFCLLQYFREQDRFILTTIINVKGQDESSYQVMGHWPSDYKFEHMVLDFPLSPPPCQTCKLTCPGSNRCLDPQIIQVKNKIDQLLLNDQQSYQKHPKTYELARLKKEGAILSKSFKRKLRKGILPYWNRPLDFWVWMNYYDLLLDVFDLSYDSYSHTSLMTFFRFNYWQQHFKKSLKLYEIYPPLVLLELQKSKIIAKKDLLGLSLLNQSAQARLDIISKIEKKLSVFIYENDIELMIKNPKAFSSFLLALGGRQILLNKNYSLPVWSKAQEDSFIIPNF